jgi:hypothetical protein
MFFPVSNHTVLLFIDLAEDEEDDEEKIILISPAVERARLFFSLLGLSQIVFPDFLSQLAIFNNECPCVAAFSAFP